MKNPIKFKSMRLVTLLILLCSLLPWQYVLSITSAQQADNSSVISMQQLNRTDTSAKWRTTYNSDAAYKGDLVISINAGTSYLDSLYWINSQGGRESLGYVTSQSQFQQIIADYRSYIASKQAYSEAYDNYVAGVASLESTLAEATTAYTTNAPTLEATTTTNQAQVSANNNDISSLEASNNELASYIVAITEETTEEVIVANAQYEAQIAAQQGQIQALQASNGELEAIIISSSQQLTSLSDAVYLAQSALDDYRVNVPTDPYSDYMETSWKVVLQSDLSKEVYQVYVPSDYRAYGFEWSVNFSEEHEQINVSSSVNLNGTTYKATDQLEAVLNQNSSSSEEEEGSTTDSDESSETETPSDETTDGSNSTENESSGDETEESSADDSESDEAEESSAVDSESDETEESTDETSDGYKLHVWNGSSFISEMIVEKEAALDSEQLETLMAQVSSDFLFWQFVPIEITDENLDNLELLVPSLADFVTFDEITWTEAKDELLDPRQPFDITQIITSDGLLIPVLAGDYVKVKFKLDEESTLETIFIHPGIMIPNELIPQPQEEASTDGMMRMASSAGMMRMASSANEFLYWTDEELADEIVPITTSEEMSELANTLDPRMAFDFSQVVLADTELAAVWNNDYHLVTFETQQEALEVDSVFVVDQLELDETYFAELDVELEDASFEYWTDLEGMYAPFVMFANETDPGSAYNIYGNDGNYGEPITELVVNEDATLYAVWDNPDKSVPSTLAAIPSSLAPELTASPTDYLQVNKTATPVEGTVNTWDILLEIEGQKSEKVADIVLVIDRSGSMSGTKMTNAIAAAKEFVDKFSGEGKVRIGIVSYATDITADLQLTPATQATTIKSKIQFKAEGGTHTQGGIHIATKMLDESTDPAPQQYIVLLSDGDPTYSYGVVYEQDDIIANSTLSGNRYITNNNYALGLSTNYNTTVGPGNNDYIQLFSRRTWINTRTYYILNSHRAIREGSIAKGKGYNIFTIGFEIASGSAADTTMAEVASSARHYKTANSTNITAIFNQISEEIIRNLAAATNMKVVDLMGAGFSIQNISSINPSQGSATYDSATHTLTWDAEDLNVPKSSTSDTVKYASMTYRLELDPSMLTVEGFNTEKWFAANESAELTHDGSPLTFPVPVIDPLLIHFEKELFDVLNEPLKDEARKFTITLTDGANNTETVVLTSGALPVYLTTLRATGNYTVTEILADDEPVNLNFYDISILISILVDGVETQVATATVNVTGNYELVNETDYDNTQPDIKVVIRNKEKPFALDILKVDGTDPTNLLTEAKFELRLTADGDGEAALDNKGNALIGTTDAKGIIHFTGIPTGTYYLVETQTPPGYTIYMTPVQVQINQQGFLDVTTLLATPIPNGVSVAKGESGIPIITVENILTGTFPNTGGWGVQWLYGLGISGVLLAMIGVWTVESRRNS